MTERQIPRSTVILTGGVISVAFALVFALGSYKAKFDFVTYLLFGAVLFFAFMLLLHEGFIRDVKDLAMVSTLLLAAFAIRMCYIDIQSGDYVSFLSEWAAFYRDNGGFKALSRKVGDYNLPYLYILALISYFPINDLFMIKLVSTIFDVLLALYAMRLCKLFADRRHLLLAAFFTVLLLPTVFINSGWWAQCDSIYTTFALAALYYGLKNRSVLAVLMGAMSFSFKLQAIFILPVFLPLLLCGRVKWKHLPLFIVFYVLMALPAIIAGRPPLDAVLIYVHQASEYSSSLTLNAPTLAVAFRTLSDTSGVSHVLIIGAFLYLALLLLAVIAKRKKLGDRETVLFALAASVGIPFMLPSMHERYFYVAEVLSVVCAFSGLVHFTLPALIQAASLICYDAYITRYYRFRLGLAALIMGCAVVFAALIFRSALLQENYESPMTTKSPARQKPHLRKNSGRSTQPASLAVGSGSRHRRYRPRRK